MAINIKRKIRGILGLNTSTGNEIEKLFCGFKRNNKYKHLLSDNRAFRLNTFYFVIDPSWPQPGLADRLKAIVSCYYICCQSGYDFKIIYDSPYPLSDYLKENKVKWKASMADLEYSKQDTKLYIYTKRLGGGLNKKLLADKQYHCYTYSGHLLCSENKEREMFNRFFNVLFCPSARLQNAIDSTGLILGEYISVHVRFVNTIGGFEDGSYPVLPPNQQVRLIERCRNAIKGLVSNVNVPVVVFSDSVRFLNVIKDLPVKILDTSNIRHLNEAGSEDAVLKTFLDFITISRSQRVYRLISKELYRSEFSVYAGYAGGIEIENVEV